MASREFSSVLAIYFLRALIPVNETDDVDDDVDDDDEQFDRAHPLEKSLVLADPNQLVIDVPYDQHLIDAALVALGN